MNTVEKYKSAVKEIIDDVNNNIGWELPPYACGAMNVWFDDGIIRVDVETSDGGVSTIDYEKFMEFTKKVSVDDFCECYV